MVKTPPSFQALVYKGLFFVIPLSLYSSSAMAVEINVATMIENLSRTMPSLMQLVTAIAYVMGMALVIKGIASLKEYGESRSSHRSDHRSLGASLLALVIGTALLYLPSSVQVGMSTFWNEPHPYAYVTEMGNDSWDQLLKSVFLILQLIGTIAFIRGLLILSNLGHHGGHQGGFGKAMAHIVGGILLINMYEFLQVIFNTLAMG